MDVSSVVLSSTHLFGYTRTVTVPAQSVWKVHQFFHLSKQMFPLFFHSFLFPFLLFSTVIHNSFLYHYCNAFSDSSKQAVMKLTASRKNDSALQSICRFLCEQYFLPVRIAIIPSRGIGIRSRNDIFHLKLYDLSYWIFIRFLFHCINLLFMLN